MAHGSPWHVSHNFLKIAARNVPKIRFVASTSPGGEGRGRKVRYRSLFRAGPWVCRGFLSRAVRNESAREGEGEGRERKEKEMERGTRDVSCVSRAKMQGKVSRAKVVTYRLCQTPPISLNDLASKNPTFLGTLPLVLVPLPRDSPPPLRAILRFSAFLSLSLFCRREILDLRDFERIR